MWRHGKKKVVAVFDGVVTESSDGSPRNGELPLPTPLKFLANRDQAKPELQRRPSQKFSSAISNFSENLRRISKSFSFSPNSNDNKQTATSLALRGAEEHHQQNVTAWIESTDEARKFYVAVTMSKELLQLESNIRDRLAETRTAEDIARELSLFRSSIVVEAWKVASDFENEQELDDIPNFASSKTAISIDAASAASHKDISERDIGGTNFSDCIETTERCTGKRTSPIDEKETQKSDFQLDDGGRGPQAEQPHRKTEERISTFVSISTTQYDSNFASEEDDAPQWQSAQSPPCPCDDDSACGSLSYVKRQEFPDEERNNHDANGDNPPCLKTDSPLDSAGGVPKPVQVPHRSHRRSGTTESLLSLPSGDNVACTPGDDSPRKSHRTKSPRNGELGDKTEELKRSKSSRRANLKHAKTMSEAMSDAPDVAEKPKERRKSLGHARTASAETMADFVSHEDACSKSSAADAADKQFRHGRRKSSTGQMKAYDLAAELKQCNFDDGQGVLEPKRTDEDSERRKPSADVAEKNKKVDRRNRSAAAKTASLESMSDVAPPDDSDQKEPREVRRKNSSAGRTKTLASEIMCGDWRSLSAQPENADTRPVSGAQQTPALPKTRRHKHRKQSDESCCSMASQKTEDSNDDSAPEGKKVSTEFRHKTSKKTVSDLAPKLQYTITEGDAEDADVADPAEETSPGGRKNDRKLKEKTPNSGSRRPSFMSKRSFGTRRDDDEDDEVYQPKNEYLAQREMAARNPMLPKPKHKPTP